MKMPVSTFLPFVLSFLFIENYFAFVLIVHLQFQKYEFLQTNLLRVVLQFYDSITCSSESLLFFLQLQQIKSKCFLSFFFSLGSVLFVSAETNLEACLDFSIYFLCFLLTFCFKLLGSSYEWFSGRY